MKEKNNKLTENLFIYSASSAQLVKRYTIRFDRRKGKISNFVLNCLIQTAFSIRDCIAQTKLLHIHRVVQCVTEVKLIVKAEENRFCFLRTYSFQMIYFTD